VYVSIRDNMISGEEFATPLEGLRELGLDAVELQLPQDFRVRALDAPGHVVLRRDEDAQAYGKKARELGVRIAALLTACDFSQGDPEDNAGWVSRAIQLARHMGAPAVRIDSAMARERELNFETRVALFAGNLGEALKRTEGSGVALGIENHGYQGNNLAFQLNVYERVGNPRLGATIDTGNFYWRGYPLSEVYGILRLLAPYAKHTHLKNIQYPPETREKNREAGWEYGRYVCPVDEGDIDHLKVAKMLAVAGYEGDLCIEDESMGHYEAGAERVHVMKRDVAHVKGILAELNAA
jgi:sugar phosphate isomerase/epimerase